MVGMEMAPMGRGFVVKGAHDEDAMVSSSTGGRMV
jgi:hypothetical protein